MREIKFRCWLPDIQMMNNWESGVDGGTKQNIEDYLDDPESILMQYTGLKDKNGKEIYEGDVVCYVTDEVVENIGSYDRTEPEGHIGKVEFSNGAFWVNSKEFAFYAYGEQNFLWSELEVIGNVWENPELLQDPISSNER